MSLFEFLMILLSLIVGLGVTEILSGYARFLKRPGKRKVPWVHATGTLAIFFALLQIFWEAWGLRTLDVWTFPAMVLMLGSPVCLYMMAHVQFPEPDQDVELDNHYFERAPVLWPLAALAVIIGTLFRPVAFGEPLLVADNLSGVPILAVCAVLAFVRVWRVHRILVPIVLASVLWDTLTFSHSIG